MFARRKLDLGRARALAEESRAAFHVAGDADGEAWSLRHLGVIAALRGDLGQAVSFTAEAAAKYGGLEDMRGLQVVVDDQATWALQLGDFARARSLFRESLERARALESDPHVASALHGLGLVALSEHRDSEAVRFFTESLSGFLRLGRRVDV